MKKPNPLTIIALSVVAIAILAFTINDALDKRNKTIAEGSLVTPKNAISTSPFVTYNPPHGKPGHRHDLPDGAPLPGIGSNQNSTAANNLPFSDTRMPQTATTPTDVTTSAGVTLNPAHGQPGHRCEIAVGAPLNSAPSSISTTPTVAAPTAAPASGKNPAHGQPGHRCDIAVGAPLNSAPAKTVSSTTASTPAANATQTAKVAPGTNPAHGQPGHRCDIAVGAPLNSAPAKTSSSTTASAPATNAAQVAKVAPGINPAHGQPGHRCDIAVGASLDQPAKTTTTTSTNKPASSLFPNYSFSPGGSEKTVSPLIDSSVIK